MTFQVRFADILREHWPRFVQQGFIPADHWRAVEAVLSCRTPRRGGHVHYCPECDSKRYIFHSCNHRNCPQCGACDRRQWSANQEARLLPVPYFLLTFTVPEPLRAFFLRSAGELYRLFLKQSARAFHDLCANRKHLGGDPGFIAVLQTWTRRMFHHPHIHLLVPGVGLAGKGCALVHPRNEEFLVPVMALAKRIRTLCKQQLITSHRELYEQIPATVWSQNWVVHSQPAGQGRSALRYLAGYISKSAFSEDRLMGYDRQGRILLRWKESESNSWRTELVDPLELIRRWLLHILPKGFVAVRHYGWLSPAAHRAFERVRFLLGQRTVRKPVFPARTPDCPCCKRPMITLGRIAPARGPPLSWVPRAALT
jgi:hypothetical protein